MSLVIRVGITNEMMSSGVDISEMDTMCTVYTVQCTPN